MTKPIRLRTTLSATTILAAGLMLAAAPARAQSLPDTGNVSSVTSGLSGGAPGSTNPTFSTSGAPGAETLRVDLKDNRTILNWAGNGFNIAAGNTVDFKDARATSGVSGRTDNIAVLNRDLSGGVSNINGNLRSDANVAVYVTNTAGIIFGQSSVTNTGALFASALDLTDANFLNTPASLHFSGSTRSGITLAPGAHITTTSNASSDGGRMGDLVLIGQTINDHAGAGAPVTLSAGGDLALVAAGAVIVQSAAGSPLSFVITTPGRETQAGEVVRVNGNLTGRNVTVATLKGTGGNGGQAIRILGDITATGATVTDRGVVLTAGLEAPGVQIAATGTQHSFGTTFFGNVTSGRDITVRDAGTYIEIDGAWAAPGKININAQAMNGYTSTITAGEVVLPGALNIGGRVVASNGNLTFHASARSDAKILFRAGAEASGDIVSDGPEFEAQSLVVAGGAIDISAGNVLFNGLRAGGPITIDVQAMASFGGETRSDGNIRITAQMDMWGGGNFHAGGSLYLLGEYRLAAGDVYGRDGVTLITNGSAGGSSIYDNGRLRIGNVSTGVNSDVYIKAQQILSSADGRAASLVAGGNMEIEIPIIDVTSIKALNGNIRLTANGTSPFGNYVRVDELFAGNAIHVASTGGLQLANLTAQTGNTTLEGSSVVLGSTSALSNVLIDGNLTVTTPGAVQLRANITTGGDITATGSTVLAGNGPISGGQIRSKGAINLTATTSGIQSNSNVLIQSNSDGIGDEAITLSAATGVSFLSGATLQGGTDRQSDVRIRSAMNSSVAISNLAARALLSATGSDPFTNGIVRNAAIGFLGQVRLVNSLYAQGTSVTVNGPITVTGNIDLRAASPISVNAALNASGDISVVTSAGNLTIGANGAFIGRDVLLSTPGAFINNGGASIMSASGRWLVYSADPAANTFGGLDSGNTAIWNGTLATRDPSTITGNRYVFAQQPTLTFSTVDFSKIYGTDLTGSAAIPFAVSGYHPGVAGAFLGDTAATAYSGNPLIQSAGFAERASVAGGPYAQTIGQGSLQSASGYALALAPSTGLVTVTPKALTGSITADDKIYDGTTGGTGSVSLDGVIAGDSVGTAGSVFTFADKNAGANKTVSVTGTSLTGADSGNYTLTIPASALADIFTKALSFVVLADGKTYDGTTAATGSVALDGVVAGDNVGATGSVFTFADKNAGTNKTVTVTGTTLTGADSGNYTLTFPATGGVADILKKAIGATVTANDKVYDGTTAATGSVVLDGVIAGDSVGTAGSAFAFADKHAGANKTVNVTGTTLTGADSGNYTLVIPAGALADILKKAITATVSADGKIYDGTTAATGSVALDGVIAGDSVGTAGSVFAFADKHAGAAKTVNVTGTVLTGSDSGNYTLTIRASALADILKKAITATALADHKTYDGTTVASGSLTLDGVVAGDSVGTTGSVFTFADKNAGTGKTVNVTGTTLTGADSGNYTLTVPASALADILKKALTASVTADSKTYDGTTAATGSVSLNGTIAGDDVGTTGTTFTFADRNAGTSKTVNVAGTSLKGANSGNYTLTVPATAIADILKKALTASVTADGKIYDGTTTATGTVALNGVVAGDTVGTSGTSFAFADKNAGTGKTVNVTGTALTGADSGNYTLTVPATALADILKKALSATVAVDSKTYDGTTAATGSVALNGIVSGDEVGTNGTSFAFADKNAGTGKTVNITGTTLTGADSGNYTLTIPATALADILKKALTASATADSKTYDGTTAATGSVALSGVVSGDAVSTAGITFTFTDKNAGTGKTVAIDGSLSGADAGNYTVTLPATALADILRKALTAGVTADSKTYDGTTAASGSVALSGVVSGDAVSTTGITFTFTDKNAGTGKTVTIGGGLSGADAGNYTVTLPATALADILKKALTANLTVSGKTYDGTTAATGSVALSGVVGGDTVGTTGASFTFADKNAGVGKTVNVTGTTLTGADSGNYTLTIPASTLADIAQRALGITADDKAKYTGDADPALTYLLTLGSLVAGDQLTGALARAAGETPGTYAINQGALSAGSNYTIIFTPGALTISVNPATNQQQTLRSIPLPAGIQAPPAANSGVQLDVEALCGEDSSCVVN